MRTFNHRIAGAFLLPVLLVACDRQPVPEPAQTSAAMPVPAETCTQVKGALDELKNRGGLTYTDAGEATIDQAAWLQLDAGRREQLEKLLAFHKSCGSDQPAQEQEIVIRDESGATVSRRVVETQADISGLIKD